MKKPRLTIPGDPNEVSFGNQEEYTNAFGHKTYKLRSAYGAPWFAGQVKDRVSSISIVVQPSKNRFASAHANETRHSPGLSTGIFHRHAKPRMIVHHPEVQAPFKKGDSWDGYQRLQATRHYAEEGHCSMQYIWAYAYWSGCTWGFRLVSDTL
jgi:hypothetical protein